MLLLLLWLHNQCLSYEKAGQASQAVNQEHAPPEPP